MDFNEIAKNITKSTNTIKNAAPIQRKDNVAQGIPTFQTVLVRDNKTGKIAAVPRYMRDSKTGELREVKPEYAAALYNRTGNAIKVFDTVDEAAAFAYGRNAVGTKQQGMMLPAMGKSFIDTHVKLPQEPAPEQPKEIPLATKEDYDAAIANLEAASAATEKKWSDPMWDSYSNFQAAGYDNMYDYIMGRKSDIPPALRNMPQLNKYDSDRASYAAHNKMVENEQKDNADTRRYLELSKVKFGEDFADGSKYTPTGDGEGVIDAPTGRWVDYGYEDIRYEIINGNKDAREKYESNHAQDGSSFVGTSEHELMLMTPEEVATFNYLYAQDEKKGDTAHTTAYEYVELIRERLLVRQRQKTETMFEMEAAKDPVGASVASAFFAPLKTISAIGQTMDYLADGEINPNASYNKFVHMENATRGQVASDIERDLGGAWGKVGSFAYNVGMSMADSGVALAISGGNSKISAFIMSSGAAATTTVNALDRGLTSGRAYTLGAVAGLAEFFCEKIKFEKLLDAESLGKGAGGYILKNMGTEALEEGTTSTVNLFADILISQDKSEWSKAVAEYMKDGHSESEAFGLAFADQAKAIGLDMLAGALSGAGSSVIGAGAYKTATKTATKPTATVTTGEITDGEVTPASTTAMGTPTVASTPTARATPTEAATDATTGARKSIESMVKNTAPITPGFIRNEYSKNIGNKTIRALDAIAKRIGVEIEIGAPTGKFGNNGVYNNGRIAIAADANVLKAVLSHEVTHHMQRTAPAEYNAFVEMAIEASEKLSGAEKAELINLIRQEWANGSESFSNQEAIDEITADYASRLVDDVSLFRELANSDRNVAQRVVDAVRDFLKKISTVFSKNAADKAALEKYGTDVEGLKKVVAQWESMLATTEEAVAGGNENTASKSKPQRSVKGQDLLSRGYSTDSQGNTLSKEQQEYFKDSKVRDKDGNLLVMYHQTEGDFTVFDPRKEGAGTTDEQTPFGIFMKTSDSDIGLKGKKQMKLYANITNPLYAETREDLARKLRGLSPEYEKIESEGRDIARTYKLKTDKASKDLDLYRIEWVKNNPEASRRAIYEDPKFNELYDIEDAIIEEWVQKSKENSVRAKNIITEALRTAGYDGVVLLSDAGSWGRKTDTYIALSPEQVKNVDNTTPTINPDIRYSKKTGDLLSKDYKPREASYLEETGLVEPDSEERSYIDDTGLLEPAPFSDKKPKGKSYIDETAMLEPTESKSKTETDVAKVARKIIKDYGSREEFAKVNDALADLYAYMPSGDKGEIQRRARAIATTMLENASVVDDTVYQENKEMRDYFRNTPISIDSRYGSDIQGYDSLSDFRKANLGRIKLTNDGAPIDTIWGEIASKFPEYFSADETLHPADMLSQVEAAFDAIQPIEYNPYSEYMGEATDALASDIIDRLNSVGNAEYKRGDGRGRRSYLEETGITETTDVRLKKLREKQRERVKKIYKGQRETVLRNKITRVTKNLDKLLRKPTDKNHILQELQKPVANLLKAINLEGTYLEYGTDAMYRRVKDYSPFAELSRRTEAFRELKKIYEKIGSEDGTITFAPELLEGDAEGRGKLFEKIIEMKDIPLYEMSEEQLRTVWNAVRAVENSVRTANKLFTGKRGQTIDGTAKEIRDGAKMKGTRVEIKGLSKLQKLVGLDMMTPEEFFHRLGKGGDAIFRMLRDAQDKKTLLLERAKDFASKLVEDEKISKLETTTHKVTLGGETVEMSTAQLMELYLLTRRKQAIEHIFKGGIRPEKLPGIKSIVRSSVIRHVTQEEVGKALDNLTAEEKKIAEKLSNFTSSVLGAEMNEASLKVFGYEKFGEANYWPIKTVETSLKTDEKQAGGKKAPPSIRNYGMASATTPGAKTPLKIGSIFDTFASHTAEATTYAAYLEATEDLRRIINYTFLNEDGGVADTMKEVVEKTFGKDGLQYWMKLDEDLSGGMQGDDGGFFGTLLKNTKAARIAGNIRVILQQPTAILRAGSMIDYKYLLEGMSHVVRGWKRAVKYSPIAKWKSYGFFDSNTGPRMKDLIFDQSGVLEKVREFGMKGTELADSFGWGVLWNACEKELAAKIKKGSVDLKVGTEDFYNAVAKRFTEIVDHTQVVDGVLQRSQIMRSSNAIDKMATSFMAEPTKTLNMFMSAVRDFAQAEKGEARTEAGKKLARTTMSLLVSFVINAALGQSLVDALRDDDKEEEYWKRWLENFGENMVDSVNPLGYIPYIKDVWSIVEGFSVERMDMDGVESVIEAAKELVASFKGESKLSTWGTINNMCAVVGTMFGLGTANVKRDVRAAVREIAAGTKNYVLEYYMAKVNYSVKYEKNKGDFYDILRRAYENDKKAYRIIRKDMLKNGFEEDEIEKKMKTETLSGDFRDALAEARDAKDSKDATEADKIVYKHLNREGNAERGTTAADKNTVVKNLPEYRELVEKYIDKYPGEDADKRVDYAYREANREMYGAEYALRVNGGKDVYEKAKAKVEKGKMTWDEYYEEYFGKTERRYAKLSKRYGLTYAEFEKVQIAISKNSEKRDEIKAIQEALGVGYARAKKIREIYYDVK